jgi:molecular chaperone GrpE (heat shock protein)
MVEVLGSIQGRVMEAQRKLVEVSDARHEDQLRTEKKVCEIHLGTIEILDLAERLSKNAEIPELKRIIQKCQSTLKRHGIQEIQAEQVTPHLVKVIETRAHDSLKPGFILEVSRKGYQMGSKVLRAMEVIAVKEAD